MDSRKANWLLTTAIALGLVLGSVSCAGAYPTGPNGSSPSGITTPGVNMPEITMPAGSGSLAYPSGPSSFPGNPGGGVSVPGSISGGIAGSVTLPAVNPGVGGVVNSLTPGAPFPMPQPNMPLGIIGFSPPDGLRVCSTPKVALSVHLTDAMRTNGAFDLSTVKLTLDGQDILSKVQLSGPMMYPQSQVTLAYVPQTALTLGAHQVRFVYPGDAGPITLTWSFIVADVGC